MEYHRKFIIKVNRATIPYFIRKIYRIKLGYYCSFTQHYEDAKYWKFKKSCENACYKLYEKYDPARKQLDKNSLEVIEITDKKTLRYLKLKKLKK